MNALPPTNRNYGLPSRQALGRHIAPLFLTLLALPLHAIVDANHNGLSDLWEKQYNSGQLFSASFDPTADPDSDGWSNAEEAIVGTDPFDSNPPTGYLRPEIGHIPAVWGDADNDEVPDIITPEAVIVTWQSIPGKQYTLLFSEALSAGAWTPVEAAFVGSGMEVSYTFPNLDATQTFWIVEIKDSNSDGDSLTDAEENELGSNPQLTDSDGDGLDDAIEFTLGTNPNSRDSDGDDIPDGDEDSDEDGQSNIEDAVAADEAIDWPRSPRPSFAVIPISKLASLPEGVSSLTVKDLNNHGALLAQSSGDWANYLLDGGEWKPLPTPDTSFTRLHMAYTFTYQSVEFSGWSKLDDDGSVYGTLEFLREGDPEGKDEAFWDSAPPDTMSKIVRASLPNFAIEVLGKTDDLDYDSSMEAGGNGVLATGVGVPASGGQTTANLAVFQSGVGPSLKPMAAAVTSVGVASVDSSGQIIGWVNEGASSHGVIWASDGAEITSAPEHFFDSVEIPGGPVPLTPRRVIAARSALYVQKTTDGPWFKSKTESFGMYPRAITRQGWILGEEGVGFGEFWFNGETHDIEDIVETSSGSTCTGISLMNESGVGIASVYTEATNTYEEVLLLPAEIVPDYNRDGKIDAKDRGLITDDNPWRFWANKDDDFGETGGTDIPGDWSDGYGSWSEDWSTDGVDGVRDLVDFFPIHIDLKAALGVFPETDYKYYLKHDTQTILDFEGGPYPQPSFAVVWCPGVDLRADPESGNGVGSYLKNVEFSLTVSSRELHKVEEAGLVISNSILQAAKEGKGIILLEGRHPTTNPLMIEIRTNDDLFVGEISFPVSISNVENMFRHRNLRVAIAPGDQARENRHPPAANRMGEPLNFPDSYSDDDWLVFLHGYNVNGEDARGWHCEAFKRMFWSGSMAKFVGVSWYGDETQSDSLLLLGKRVTPKYYENVENALMTAESLSGFVNGLSGGKKYLAAHSLGCLVTTAAMAEHGMQAEKAFLYDAAIATESLLPGNAFSNDLYMEPSSWRSYPREIKASEWYMLFPDEDSRSTLTWRGLLYSVASKVKVFYSPGEEVLTAIPLDVDEDPGWAGSAPQGSYAFALQALLKGQLGSEPDVSQSDFSGKLTSAFTHAFEGLSPASPHGGWRWTSGVFQPRYQYLANNRWVNRSPGWFLEMLYNSANLERLKVDPVFGRSVPEGCDNLFDPVAGSQVASVAWRRNRILAQMIPERSLPAGGAGGSGIAGEVISLKKKYYEATGEQLETYNMEANRTNGKWPPGRPMNFGNGWHHGDIREVAYAYVWKSWEEVVNDIKQNR